MRGRVTQEKGQGMRAMLACTVCGDKRPDADVESEGVSVGAQCPEIGCGGVYRDALPVHRTPVESYGTVWVCVDCMMHHANGECGSCHDDNGHDCEPLSFVGEGFHVAAGMTSDEHDAECLRYVLHDVRTRFPDVDWPELPGDHECDCETNTFSRSQCRGCGSYLHGERHALTLFKG